MFIAEGLAAINAALKAIELWERMGPTSGGIQTLNLNYHPAEFTNLAAQVVTGLDGDYEELFKGTAERVRRCVRNLQEATGDETFLPNERRKFGKAARMCVCREIAIIEDFMVGDLPEELKKWWLKHKCAEARAPMAATN